MTVTRALYHALLKLRSFNLRAILTVMLIAAMGGYDASGQSSQTIRTQQKRTQQKITNARNKKAENEKTVQKKLRDLDLLDAQVVTLNKDLHRLQGTSDSLKSLIRPLLDSISNLNNRLDNMQSRYITALKRSQLTHTGSQTGMLAFIFTSSDFTEAWERYHSLQQFARWQRRKAQEIKDTRHILETRATRLDSLDEKNRNILDRARQQRNEIENRRIQTDRLVSSLKTQSKNLDKVMKRYEKEARDLDRKLEEAIQREIDQRRKLEEDERRRAAAGKNNDAPQDNKSLTQTTTDIERRLSNDFETNKGRLPFPIKGSYEIVKKYGRQRHPRLPKVETNNSGIDIETTSSASVHAVFTGEISQIFKLPGYHNVIVIRHGNYVTVYAGLSSLDVKKGDRVDTGQQIGRLWADGQDGNRSILHFELRHEKEKQDPEAWLKP